MSKVKFKLNLPGLNALMKGPEMQAVLASYGDRVLNAARNSAPAGAEFSANTRAINWIAVTTVRTDNYEAQKDNYDHNTLLKALGGARG